MKKKKKHLICVTVVSHAGCITEVGTGVGASLPPTKLWGGTLGSSPLVTLVCFTIPL